MKLDTKNRQIAVVAIAVLLALPAVSNAAGTLFVNNDKVGIGVALPENQLHILKTTAGNSVMAHYENNGAPIMEFEDTNLGVRWGLNPDGLGSFVITKFGTGGAEFTVKQDGTIQAGPGAATVFTLTPAGNLTISGTLTQGSSRTIKHGFATLNPREMLDKVAGLDVLEWSYTDQSTRHIGPMAEDFRSIFGTGDSAESLAPADVAGVTLAAVQGLNQLVAEKDQQIQQLSSELEELRAMVEALASH